MSQSEWHMHLHLSYRAAARILLLVKVIYHFLKITSPPFLSLFWFSTINKIKPIFNFGVWIRGEKPSYTDLIGKTERILLGLLCV